MKLGVPVSIDWSIGIIPVQEWIAAARRSRDLFVGSRILSIFMDRALRHLDRHDANVWFPHFDASEGRDALPEALLRKGYSLTNRAAGSFDARPLREVRAALVELGNLIDETWDELCTVALDGKAGKELARIFGKDWKKLEQALRGAPCPVEIVWCAHEVAAAGEPDVARVDAIETLFTDVKRTRPARPWRGDAIPKCVQCGRREALGNGPLAKFRDFRERVDEQLAIRGGYLDEGELLCPVCTVRRLLGYRDDRRFPSTSEIAGCDWLYRLETVDDLKSLTSAWEKAAKAAFGSHQAPDPFPLLYRTSLRRDMRRARERGQDEVHGRLKRVETALQALREEIQQHNKKQKEAADHLPEAPCDYLAVLVFDGDDMGRRVREQVGELPKKLAEFSKELANRFPGVSNEDGTEPSGALAEPFYLGGDEGLMLCPLSVAIDTAQDIHRLWQDIVAKDDKKLTLSAAIVVFDRERPLGAAIDRAHATLHAAKDLRDCFGNRRKDALAVAVQTASGSDWDTAAPWEAWGEVQALVTSMDEGLLAAGWSHDAERLLRQADLDLSELGPTERQVLTDELRRLTWRRVRGPREKREERFAYIWSDSGAERWLSGEAAAHVDLGDLADRLHLVGYLARQVGRRASKVRGGEAA
jgi:CRISPR-associated protein Cmr2